MRFDYITMVEALGGDVADDDIAADACLAHLRREVLGQPGAADHGQSDGSFRVEGALEPGT